jgi:hypothetical protein
MTETEHPRIRQNKVPFLPRAVLERELTELDAAMQLDVGSSEAIDHVLRRTVEGYAPSATETDSFEAAATWTPPTRTLH